MNKRELRKQMKELRLSLDKDIRLAFDKEIYDKIYELIKPYDTVLCYVSSGIEVDTRMLLARLFEDKNKRVLVPKCVNGTNIMHFYPVSGFDDLESGSYRIEEPKEGITAVSSFGDNCCCIMPALCYDERGYRVGFGKGYYDRFLSGFGGKRIGICYSLCMVDKIDNDENDIKAEIIVTDKKISYT